MNGRTFSPNPGMWGKSRHHHYQSCTDNMSGSLCVGLCQAWTGQHKMILSVSFLVIFSSQHFRTLFIPHVYAAFSYNSCFIWCLLIWRICRWLCFCHVIFIVIVFRKLKKMMPKKTWTWQPPTLLVICRRLESKLGCIPLRHLVPFDVCSWSSPRDCLSVCLAVALSQNIIRIKNDIFVVLFVTRRHLWLSVRASEYMILCHAFLHFTEISIQHLHT